MNCHQCDQELSTDNSYRFCPYCGESLESRSSPSNTIPIIEEEDDTIPVPSPFANEAKTEETTPDKKKRSFSETAWFMASALPEDLDDATPENYTDIDKMNEPYEQTGKLPSPLRKEFSLSESAQHKAAKDAPEEK